MKKYLALLSTILIITSCDVEEGPFITDFDSYVNPDKKVLIEDFTGHTCPNCPAAARELEAIHAIYGDQIIGMALHVTTGFAAPHTGSGKYEYDFRTKWGTDWDNLFEISNSGLPRGMVNRIGVNSETHKLGKDEWASAVALELKKDIDFKIHISSDENEVTIISEVISNVSSDYNLVVCLTESHIINWQKDGQENIEDYEHNHVLRTVLVEESLSSASNLIIGQQIEKIIAFDLAVLEQANIDYSANTAINGSGNAGGWNAENISVIAYIYDNTTKEIVQVEDAHLNN